MDSNNKEVTGGRRRSNNEKIHNLRYNMARRVEYLGEMRNTYKILDGEL
jgi:hypothetical protein